jgi:hypothetical protein
VPTRKGRKPHPHGEPLRPELLGHLEVDAALDRPRERRVRSEPFSKAERTSGLLDVEIDPVGRAFQPDREVPQEPSRRGAENR